MISPTRYNLNLFIFSPSLSMGEEEIQGGGGVRLMKEDNGGQVLKFYHIAIRCYKYLQYLCSQCFLCTRIFIFSCLLSITPPPSPPCPQILCQTILNQAVSFYVCMYTSPLSVFTELLFLVVKAF